MYALVNFFHRKAKKVFLFIKIPKFFFLVPYRLFKLYAVRLIGTENELSTSNLNSKQEQEEVSELLQINSI